MAQLHSIISVFLTLFPPPTGRTFPTHPYFSAQLGAGQLSLYNILKAYSLLDQEVGYCQGLSFVAGVLLLHMSEEEAFKMLKFLMFDMGLRKQYRPDMTILQVWAPAYVSFTFLMLIQWQKRFILYFQHWMIKRGCLWLPICSGIKRKDAKL